MERYELWITRAKSSLELAGAKIIRYIQRLSQNFSFWESNLRFI
jgi:hypothetical protein